MKVTFDGLINAYSGKYKCNVTNQTANCDTYSASFGILWQTCANENHLPEIACDTYSANKVTKTSNNVSENWDSKNLYFVYFLTDV